MPRHYLDRHGILEEDRAITAACAFGNCAGCQRNSRLIGEYINCVHECHDEVEENGEL